MRKRGLRVPFECISRADRLNAEAADLLAELGCFRVWIGSESGSQRILDVMERGVTVEQVHTAVDLCKARGIQTGMFLMWGYEGEEIEDIEATIEHVKRTDPDVFLTTVSYPIKGTPYYERVANSLVQLKPWSISSDREIVLRGRRSPEFYENADRLLRSEVQLARLRHGAESMVAEHDLQLQVRALRESLYSKSCEVSA
jgi:anaerobic magnesium-protoporphyrin IX monomethyl ester cyclase